MPLSIKRRVTLDLSRTGYQITIPFMKSDRVAHEIYITVKDGTEPVILPPGTMAAITVFNGVEGGVVDNLVVDHVNNVLMYVPSPNALAVAGNVKCTLTLFDELGAVIGAPSMIFGVMNSDTEEIGEEIQAALEANPSWGLIVTAAQSAESAKASATEAGVSAEEARASELLAELHSEAAKASETKVNMYKTDALTYRNVAELKATEAGNSATAAKASEESARADAESVVGSRAEIDSEINRVSDTADEALSIASGATQAITVQDYAALVELLNNTNKFEFNVGQNIYVETLDVPDVWIKDYANDPIEYTYTTDANLERELLGGYLQIGYTLLSPLEGAKVDLTEYAKKTYVNSEIGKSEDRSSTKIREANERIDANEAAINSANEQIDSANRSISANTANITALEQSTAEQITTVAKHTASVESKAIRNDKRLTNLEAGIPDDDFITDNSVAYVRDVPANALPYAEITEIGGMTRKCTNLIPSPYLSTVSNVNGVSSIVNENGTIAFSGKCISGWTYTLCEKLMPAGKYYLGDGVTVTGINLIAYDIDNSAVISWEGAFSLTKDTMVRVYYLIADTFNGNCVVSPMLNLGETALPYEPFFEGLRSAPVSEVVSEGVNLFGGEALANKIVEVAGGVIDEKSQTVRFLSTGINGKVIFDNFKTNTVYTFILSGWNEFGNGSNLLVLYTDGTVDYLAFKASQTHSVTVFKSNFTKSVKAFCGVNYSEYTNLYYNECGIFEGDINAEDFKPYIKRTLTMPEAVQALPDYGVGIPNTDYYNRIRWRYDEQADKWVREYMKRAKKIVFDGVTNGKKMDATDNQAGGKSYYYAYLLPDTLPILSDAPVIWSGEVDVATISVLSVAVKNDILKLGDNPTSYEITNAINAYLNALYVAGKPVEVVYVPAEHTTEDISDILPEDNLLGVEGRGSMTPVNKHGYAVPMTITYQIEEEAV